MYQMLIPNIFEKYPEYIPKKGVLHIGAHTFEEEPYYLQLGIPLENILWIEGNPELIPKDKTNVICAVIGNEDDVDVTFHITNNMQSSSILPLKTHLIEHPWVHEIKTQNSKMITINTLFSRYAIQYAIQEDAFDFINLDIQGAELMALQGATKILPHIRSIYTEINVKELYEGCAQLTDLDIFLGKHGFTRVEEVITSHGWGDAFYVKKDV